jgi:hypothetical protein
MAIFLLCAGPYARAGTLRAARFGRMADLAQNARGEGEETL